MKKILLYYTHRETLGHTTRVISIVKEIIRKYKKNIKIYVLNGGMPQKYLEKPREAEWFDVPFPYHNRWQFSNYIDKRLLLIEQYKIKVRREYIFNKANKIRPDVFITELFPFGNIGSSEELLKTLELLKEKGRNIYASIGYPCILPSNINSVLNLSSFYDKYFIHVPQDTETNYFIKNIKDKNFNKVYKNLLYKISNKIIYTGYVFPYSSFLNKEDNKAKKQITSDRGKLIIVSRGGGVTYPKIILFSMMALKYIDKNYRFTILAGPATLDAEMQLFKKVTKSIGNNKIILKKYEPNFLEYLSKCDLSISMAGYNTSVQLLFLSKKSIVIPYEPLLQNRGYCSEQVSRSQLLKDCIGSEIIKYKELTSELLCKKIQKKLLEPSVVNNKKAWYSGSEITADIIARN